MTTMFTQNAKTTDPLTSHEAGVMLELSGVADSHRALCMEAVERFPGRTSAELAECGCFDDWDADKRRHEVARRLPELRERGAVENGPARKCEATGHKGLTWYPAGKVERDIDVLRSLYRDLDRLNHGGAVHGITVTACLIGAAESLGDEEVAMALLRMFWRCRRAKCDAGETLAEAMGYAKSEGTRLKGKVEL